MKSIYVLDAMNFLFRAYYAIGSMTNPQGESTNALYGFIRSVFKIMKDFSPTHLVAVFDGPESTKQRKAIYSDYKIHRTKMPEDLYSQLEKTLILCELAGIPFLSIPGFEADDVMGSIAAWAEKQGTDVYLCTSDKDLCQLVSDHVFVINPHKENLKIDAEKVKEIFGVTPKQIVDLLAMMGDASDNIPGIPGVGPKTASGLLQEFGSLEGIFANLEKIPHKKKEVLANGKENAFLSRELAQIHIGVDFPKEDDFFRIKAPNIDKLTIFYQEMHFMSLIKELKEQQPASSEQQVVAKPEVVTYRLIDEEDDLLDLTARLMKEREICVDTETTDLNPMEADLVGIGFCVQSNVAWYIPCNGKIGKKRVLEILRPLLEHASVHFFGHNIKYDLHVFLNQGIEIRNISFDTILASYLLNPQKQKHGLDPLSLEKFGKVKISIEELIGKGKKQISMRDVPLEKVMHYCCEDVDYTFRLKELFQKELEREHLLTVFQKIELPLIPILLHMERKGVYINLEKMRTMNRELSQAVTQLQEEIFALAGESFNLNSPKQLGEILFEKLQIKPAKKTQTGYSTSVDVLEALKEISPIIEKIIAYRMLEKLRSTYVESLPEQVLKKTHRVHCTFNQSVAATGRLSCQNPNLQNIPIRSVEGRKIREAFAPELPHWSFLSADYSQIELRLLAHLSDDPALMQAFHAGEDIHAYTASLVFNIPLQDVLPEMRDAAKAVNFGILYGQQAFGLSKELNIDIKEAAKFIETYFQRYKKVKEYLEESKESVRKTGKAFTITGRQRPIPEIHSTNPMIRQAADRLAVNTPLQGAAADLIKLAMIQIDRMLHETKTQGYMILQIHDELIFEVPDSQVENIGKKVKQIMEEIIPLKVPLLVNISIGKNWGEC